jgi:hypothetical protein
MLGKAQKLTPPNISFLTGFTMLLFLLVTPTLLLNPGWLLCDESMEKFVGL